MKATVNETWDTGEAKSFEDENGRIWNIILEDLGCGIVESNEGFVPLAGEFTWYEDGPEIIEKAEGVTFGVNCQDEYIVRDGRWTENEEA